MLFSAIKFMVLIKQQKCVRLNTAYGLFDYL